MNPRKVLLRFLIILVCSIIFSTVSYLLSLLISRSSVLKQNIFDIMSAIGILTIVLGAFSLVDGNPSGTGLNTGGPIGEFTFGTGFRKNPNPGLKVPYRKVTSKDYWVDDPNSKHYNTWEVGPANGRWHSAEKLLRSDWLYNYAMVINYNNHPIIKRKGSAIFLHEWRSSKSVTAGCTATDEKTLLSIMK